MQSDLSYVRVNHLCSYRSYQRWQGSSTTLNVNFDEKRHHKMCLHEAALHIKESLRQSNVSDDGLVIKDTGLHL